METAHNLPPAPEWSLLVGKLGSGFVWAGIVFFVASIVGAILRRERLSGYAFFAGAMSVFGAFASLAALFITDQFHFRYVFAHSEKVNGLGYKIASIWSGQEGSFLLWATCSALFVLLARRGARDLKRWYTFAASVFLGAVCGILAYETPFSIQDLEGKIVQIPDGVGLAPSLNNYWVIIHPPTIFLGFGSLLVLFSFAVAALIQRDYDSWAARLRPWAIVSMTFTGLGLCMGGFWAYETLGWGGFWAWDPVENVSFVPWVLTTVLVHGLIVQAARSKWQFSNLLLAGAPFLAFTYGTFLTRAGFLDQVSVHSFAKMNESAHKLLLWFLVGTVVLFTGLWFTRLRQDGARYAAPALDGLRRDGLYRTGMQLMTMLAIATAIGMSVPLLQYAMGKTPKVVEEQLYHQVLVWFFVPILLLMAIAPFASWRAMRLGEFVMRLINVFSLSLFVVGISLLVGAHPEYGVHLEKGATIDFPFGLKVLLAPWILFLVWLCAFTTVANLWRLIETVRRAPLSTGAFLAHIGVAVAMAGLIVSRGLERKQEYALQRGIPALGLRTTGPAHIVELVEQQKFDFFDRNNKVELRMRGDGPEFIARPGLYYDVNQQTGEPSPVTWPHIQRWLSHDMYVVLYPLQPDASNPVTLKPGESTTLDGMVWQQMSERQYQVRYLRMEREGEAGMAGTRFKAILQVTGPDGQVEIAPELVVGTEGGPQRRPVRIDTEFGIELDSMNAADQAVTLKLTYNIPVFPVETFYKPMTILVWGGVGILTVGGLIAAWGRRGSRRAPVAESAPSDIESVEKGDALIPVP